MSLHCLKEKYKEKKIKEKEKSNQEK